MPSLGLVANVYNEIHALPGWLETHIPFFDDVRVYHAGPQGQYSNDGTIELLEHWRIPVIFGSIDEGFGVVRTKTVRMSPCDFVMLLDADERFYQHHVSMACEGDSPQATEDVLLQSYDFRDLTSAIPNWENIGKLGADLRVKRFHLYDQGAYLRSLLYHDVDALTTVRRHWHDFTWKRPTKNWHTCPDLQLRLVRNIDSVYYDPSTRMHERLLGASNVVRSEVYFDHFHLWFKRQEMWQRAHDVEIYNRIHAGELPPTWEEYKK